MESIVRSERGWAHRLIEEFMLSANECVATWIEKNAIPGVYRIHETPDPKRILDFEETASGFGYSLGFASLPVKQDNDEGGPARGRPARGWRPWATAEDARGGGTNPGDTADVPAADEKRLQANRRADSELPDAAVAEAGAIQRAERRPLCAGEPALHAFHLADPALPGLIVHRLVRELLRSGAKCARRGDSEHGPAALEQETVPVTNVGEKRAAGVPVGADSGAGAGGDCNESSQAERRADDAERRVDGVEEDAVHGGPRGR